MTAASTRRWPVGVLAIPSFWKMLVMCFSTAAVLISSDSLDAHDRREAVLRAREYGLLKPRPIAP